MMSKTRISFLQYYALSNLLRNCSGWVFQSFLPHFVELNIHFYQKCLCCVGIRYFIFWSYLTYFFSLSFAFSYGQFCVLKLLYLIYDLFLELECLLFCLPSSFQCSERFHSDLRPWTYLASLWHNIFFFGQKDVLILTQDMAYRLDNTTILLSPFVFFIDHVGGSIHCCHIIPCFIDFYVICPLLTK